MPSYPTTVKTFTLKQDGVDDVLAAHINDLQDEVHAIEHSLWANVARASTAAAQNIANATVTIVNFDTVDYDPQSMVTVGAAWKCTILQAGYYMVNANLTFQSTATFTQGETWYAALYKNGAIFSYLWNYSDESSVAHYPSGHGLTMVYLAIADYIDLRVYQASGGALTLHNSAVHCYIDIARVA